MELSEIIKVYYYSFCVYKSVNNKDLAHIIKNQLTSTNLYAIVKSMIPLERALFIKRKDTARLLAVSVHMMEVWCSNGNHATLHKNASKIRGRCYYRLSDVEDFLKEWDKERYYEIYTTDGRGFLNWLAKLED